MGSVNPFFEKAGMKAYRGKTPSRCAQLIEALSMAGIEENELIDSRAVQRKIERLGRKKGEFIEFQIRQFLEGYGERRFMKAGIERTRFVLGKLSARSVYYVWFNSSACKAGNR